MGALCLIRATALARHPAGMFDDGSELWAGAEVHPCRLNIKQPGAKDSSPGGPLQHCCLDRYIHSQSDGEGGVWRESR